MTDCSQELTNNERHKIQSQDFRIGGRVQVRPYVTHPTNSSGLQATI
jgi:hypothetical protein